GRRVEVVPHDHDRAADLLERGHRAQGYHPAAIVAETEPFQVFDLFPERHVTLHVHLPGAAEPVEVVHVQRAQVDLDPREDPGHTAPQHLDHGAIDIEVQPGCTSAEPGEESSQIGVFRALGDGRIHNVLQRIGAVVAAVLDDDLETAGRA